MTYRVMYRNGPLDGRIVELDARPPAVMISGSENDRARLGGLHEVRRALYATRLRYDVDFVAVWQYDITVEEVAERLGGPYASTYGHRVGA